MADDYIVAFLDILGFEDLMRGMDSAKYFEAVDNIFSTVEATIESLKSWQSPEREPLSELLQLIGVEIISDSLIVYISINDATVLLKKHYKELNFEAHIRFMFFGMISLLVWKYFLELKCLVRGGIAIGPFLRNELKKGTVVNSKIFYGQVLIDAYRLEQKAVYPRILVSSYIATKWAQSVPSFINKDFVKGVIKKTEIDDPYFDWFMYIKSLPGSDDMLHAVNDMLSEKIISFRSQCEYKKIEKWIWFRNWVAGWKLSKNN